MPQFQGVARKGYTLRGLQGDSLSLLDRSVGRLMDLFVELGIEDDTLFIFSAGASGAVSASSVCSARSENACPPAHHLFNCDALQTMAERGIGGRTQAV